MIPEAHVTAWAAQVPWPNPEQVEQDLLLSRLIIEIAADPYLGAELIFRRGTCFHKLHLDEARRYSEDLDYVRSTAGGIGAVFDGLREVASRLGMHFSTARTAHPKMYLKGETVSGARLRIKVEVNTHERSPARPPVRVPYDVESAGKQVISEVFPLINR